MESRIQNIPVKTKLKREGRTGLLLLFLVWPFVAFLVALPRYFRKQSRLIIFLFLILFGFTFMIENKAFDSNHLVESMKTIASQPFNSFWEIISGLYTGTSVDFILPLIMFIITRITTSQNIFYMVLAGIFAWFYLKSISYIYDNQKLKGNYNAIIHFVFFIFLIPIFNINGFRFWTSAWMFFYGAYRIITAGEKRFFVFTLLAAFTHFSFISANIILVAYLLIGNRNLLFYILLVFSLIVPEIFSSQIEVIFSNIGGALQTKYNIYTNIDYIEKIEEGQQGLKWFMFLSSRGIYYYTLFMLLYIKFKHNKLIATPEFENLFSFSIFFISIYNFFRYIPSASRFQTVFYLFATAYITFFYYTVASKKIKFSSWLGLFPMILTILISLRIGFEMTNIWFFTPTPFIFLADPLSVFNLIRDIF
jgi:hypothetical protein